MSFYLAPSLAKLRDEIDDKWPARDKRSDGWIGDASHNARKSDHNPDWDSGGVVRALDIDIDGIDRLLLLRELIGDPRVWYVISNRIIYSRTYGWAARAYTGSNPHTAHVHVSIVHSKSAETNTSRWLDVEKRRDKGMPRVHLRALQAQARDATRATRGVRVVQRALRERYDVELDVDGWWGDATRRAYRRHEALIKRGNPDGFPGLPSLRNLARGRFIINTPEKGRNR